MKELTLETLLAVFEEMFGGLFFWFLVIAAVIVTAAYLFVLVRDRSVSMKKFLWAQVSMPFGAVAAVALVLGVTNSSLSDLGGPIDVIVFLGIAVLGAVGISILVYTVQSLLMPPRAQ
ncbi:MAG: hypothetical protein CMJ42_02285 [Phyllobacteriaceae bacterium]|nr:hypothetical protein [Phyllobacteriaceae bacterium]MBA93155.1 hypothetical protein [Phyllobacteriaceae bacterium]